MDTIVALGLVVHGYLEGWILAVFAVVIALDLYLSKNSKLMFYLLIFQIFGLCAGYLWTMWVFYQQDVAGPWVWAMIVGGWTVYVTVVHLWYILRSVGFRR